MDIFLTMAHAISLCRRQYKFCVLPPRPGADHLDSSSVIHWVALSNLLNLAVPPFLNKTELIVVPYLLALE